MKTNNLFYDIVKFNKSWGHYKLNNAPTSYVVKKVVVNPNSELSQQYHIEKEETMTCIKGYGKLLLWDKLYTLKPGVTIHISPGDVHKLINDSDKKLIISEASTGREDDIVRLDKDSSPVDIEFKISKHVKDVNHVKELYDNITDGEKEINVKMNKLNKLEVSETIKSILTIIMQVCKINNIKTPSLI